MAVEIERKFLVRGTAWRHLVTSSMEIRQGYLPAGDLAVRVRISHVGSAFSHTLTVKGMPDGLARPEFEFEIPEGEALEMLRVFCSGRTVEKIRYIVPIAGPACLHWEIDEFLGRHASLVVAEVELDKADRKVRLPRWIGEEVSADPRYSNKSLAINGLRLIGG